MLTSVLETAKAIRPFLPPTPLVPSLLLSKHFGCDVWLKLETESPVGSFKARGALRCLMRRSQEGHRGFTTASTGNHGMAVAYAGRQLGLPTHVFIPKNGSARKITFADGLASRVAAPEAAELMNKFVDDMVLVSEEQIMDALKLFVRSECRIIEPSSAAALAALGLPELRAGNVVAIMTGRNYEIS